MRTLTEIAKLLAPLDNIEERDLPQYEKALRNLVQRHYLPPTEQQGRVFLYDEAALAAIRLASVASDFGLPRATIDSLTRWLFAAGERRAQVEGGAIALSHVVEAIERVQDGEEFCVHIVMSQDRTFLVSADWKSAPITDRVQKALASRDRIEIARFTVPASRLIAVVLSIKAGN